MSKEQIEEMAKVICEDCARDPSPCALVETGKMCSAVWEQAETLYNAGYRKQREGEWGFDGMSWTCSECGEYATKGIKTTFCPNCGTKMKGGKE